jgi:hypothetical protein
MGQREFLREDQQFDYSGTHGFTARIEAVAPAGAAL